MKLDIFSEVQSAQPAREIDAVAIARQTIDQARAADVAGSRPKFLVLDA